MHVEENIPYIERFLMYIQEAYNAGVKVGKKYQLEATFKVEVRLKTLLTMYENMALIVEVGKRRVGIIQRKMRRIEY